MELVNEVKTLTKPINSNLEILERRLMQIK